MYLTDILLMILSHVFNYHKLMLLTKIECKVLDKFEYMALIVVFLSIYMLWILNQL